MKIDRIELFHLAFPLEKPFYPAWIPGYPQTVNRFTLARMTTDEGVQGLAAGAAFSSERAGLGDLLGPYLIGLDPCDIETGRQRIREASYLGWRNYWLEAAFWDIKGKVEGKPLWQMLGGDSDRLSAQQRLPVYASTGEIHPPEQRAEEVLALGEQGFDTVKLRVHDFDAEEDIRLVRTVAEAVNGRLQIGVDANQGWRVALIDDAPLWGLDRAAYFADACADLGVAWLEEPLDMHAWDDLAELRRRSRVPVAGGELNDGWHEFRVMLEKGCFDIYQPDATFGGGISDAKRVQCACAAQGLHFAPHTWSNGFSMVVNLHVHASGAMDHPLEYPIEPPGWTPKFRDALLTEPVLADENGTVAIPTAPGLGIEIDENQLKRHGEKFFDLSSKGLAIKTIREKGLFTALRLARKKRRR
ncbi:MAG: mandelate racemase/muconate lactonizing enzyme family protein [Xanthomonadales bacterium]|nr:mandelate racemase/muconate lactonizing enzyme family protein [Gammaproteobacteria bacterium]NNL05041.1 mandelate racemase/muconate lactonizing enzyme family protein [Xanthomonadales bacterium]